MQAFSLFSFVVFVEIVFVSDIINIILNFHLISPLKIIITGIEFSFEAMIYSLLGFLRLLSLEN